MPSRFNKPNDKKKLTIQKSKPTFVPRNLKKINNNSHSREYKDYSYEEGMKVKHDRFGIGVICKLEGEGANKKISVNFTGLGEKTLLAKFAKLNILK